MYNTKINNFLSLFSFPGKWEIILKKNAQQRSNYIAWSKSFPI